MTDSYSMCFPLRVVPDPDEASADYLAQVTSSMQRTRQAVAPNPLAQALYPTLRPYKPKREP